jgi:hypothetical protein
MSKSLSFKIILLLALVQGVAGMVRAFNWVQIGVDLFGQGLLLLPFVGAVAVMRGLFISVVALLYVLFVIGALLGKGWAWWFCLTAVIVNLLLVLSVLAQGPAVAAAIAWSVIPLVLLAYLFSQMGRDALKGAESG